MKTLLAMMMLMGLVAYAQDSHFDTHYDATTNTITGSGVINGVSVSGNCDASGCHYESHSGGYVQRFCLSCEERKTTPHAIALYQLAFYGDGGLDVDMLRAWMTEDDDFLNHNHVLRSYGYLF